MQKRILITGATSGIGLRTAEIMRSKGYRLLLTGRNTEKIEHLANDLVKVERLDVTDYDALSKLSHWVTTHWGGLDVLVNNAGLGIFEPLHQGKIEDWHLMFDTNVKGLLNAVHAFLPTLIQSKGHIVNIGSVASHQVFANSGIYCATKHAVLAISESLRIELSDKIRVTTISPGNVNTPFISHSTNPDMQREYARYFQDGLDPSIIAEEIIHTIESPERAVISEVIIRPNRQIK
jgi:NADP-dependent 3-hydroxy acid dehydrogenase YdfG